MTRAFEIKASNPRPTAVGVKGGMDVDVTLNLAHTTAYGEVTLVPDRVNGGWGSLGAQPVHWVSPGLMSVLDALGDRDLREVLGAIRDAAAPEIEGQR